MTKRKEEQQGSGEQSKRGRGREPQPMPWFAVHFVSRRHPKLIRLAEEWGMSKAEAYGYLVQCWGWAAEFTQKTGGVFFFRDTSALSADVGWPNSPALLVDGLKKAGWLEGHGRDSSGRLIFHEWDKVQEPLAKQRIRERERKRAYRAKKKTAPPRAPIRFVPGTNAGQSQDGPGDPLSLPLNASSSLRAQSGFAGTDSNSLNRRRSASSSSSFEHRSREEEEDGDRELNLTADQLAFEAIQAQREARLLSREPMPSWWPSFYAAKAGRHGDVLAEAYAAYLDDEAFASHRWTLAVFRTDAVCEQRLGAAAELRRVAELG